MHPISTFDLHRLDQQERLAASLRAADRARTTPVRARHSDRHEHPPDPSPRPAWFGNGLRAPLVEALR